MNYIHPMTYHPPITETGFARLRAVVARAAARALGLDRMKALLIAQIQAAIAQLEALFAAWQAGTLPPAPQATPAQSHPLATHATEPAAPIPAPPARTPFHLFQWPLFSRASLGEAVLGWLLPPLPAARRAPGSRPARACPRQAYPKAAHTQAASEGPEAPSVPPVIRTCGPIASAPPWRPSHTPGPPGIAIRPPIIRPARPPPASRAKNSHVPQGRRTPYLLRYRI